MPRRKGDCPPKSPTERSREFRARRAKEREEFLKLSESRRWMPAEYKPGALAKVFSEGQDAMSEVVRLKEKILRLERRIEELKDLVRKSGGAAGADGRARFRSQRK